MRLVASSDGSALCWRGLCDLELPTNVQSDEKWLWRSLRGGEKTIKGSEGHTLFLCFLFFFPTENHLRTCFSFRKDRISKIRDAAFVCFHFPRSKSIFISKKNPPMPAHWNTPHGASRANWIAQIPVLLLQLGSSISVHFGSSGRFLWDLRLRSDGKFFSVEQIHTKYRQATLPLQVLHLFQSLLVVCGQLALLPFTVQQPVSSGLQVWNHAQACNVLLLFFFLNNHAFNLFL